MPGKGVELLAHNGKVVTFLGASQREGVCAVESRSHGIRRFIVTPGGVDPFAIAVIAAIDLVRDFSKGAGVLGNINPAGAIIISRSHGIRLVIVIPDGVDPLAISVIAASRFGIDLSKGAGVLGNINPVGAIIISRSHVMRRVFVGPGGVDPLAIAIIAARDIFIDGSEGAGVLGNISPVRTVKISGFQGIRCVIVTLGRVDPLAIAVIAARDIFIGGSEGAGVLDNISPVRTVKISGSQGIRRVIVTPGGVDPLAIAVIAARNFAPDLSKGAGVLDNISPVRTVKISGSQGIRCGIVTPGGVDPLAIAVIAARDVVMDGSEGAGVLVNISPVRTVKISGSQGIRRVTVTPGGVDPLAIAIIAARDTVRDYSEGAGVLGNIIPFICCVDFRGH